MLLCFPEIFELHPCPPLPQWPSYPESGTLCPSADECNMQQQWNQLYLSCLESFPFSLHFSFLRSQNDSTCFSRVSLRLWFLYIWCSARSSCICITVPIVFISISHLEDEWDLELSWDCWMKRTLETKYFDFYNREVIWWFDKIKIELEVKAGLVYLLEPIRTFF